MTVDLSAVFCSEPDEGQEVHDSMPPEVWRHLGCWLRLQRSVRRSWSV
jgi:hypothetical protein